MERGKSVWLVLVLVITIVLFSENSIEISAEIQEIEISNLVTHEPIEIICDQNFTDYGFPGSGTKSDPFIISSFKINTTNSNQNNIMIKYTTKYFVIENCELTKPSVFRYPNLQSPRQSIYLRDCKNGTAIIRNNLCEGISIRNSTYFVIEGNEFKDSIDNGILVDYSPYTIIRNNYVHNNGIGIHIYHSHHCLIERNEVINNSGYLELVSGMDDLYIASGIYLNWKCSHNVVQDNYVVNNRHGIKVYRSDRVNITSNVIVDSKETSLYCHSSNSNIFNNTITEGDSGIWLSSNYRGTVSYNNISYNEWYGISLAAKCKENKIHHNRFIDNGKKQREKGKIDSQAQDWGEDNVWFDETTTEGNYWSDLKKIPYLIDGPAKSFDPYPINFIIDKTYLLINPLLTILPFIITLIYFLKVKYKRDKLKFQNPLQ